MEISLSDCWSATNNNFRLSIVENVVLVLNKKSIGNN